MYSRIKHYGTVDRIFMFFFKNVLTDEAFFYIYDLVGKGIFK